ncbi:MAG TPA: hypothetical protein VL995_18805 [Cellvibrio sp.]|nr:hypothetical protein [Cellvibrio sp.]
MALHACAKSENTSSPSVEKKTEKILFATRSSISNDQKFDVDGDGKSDVVEVVTIGNTAQLPPSINLVTPWAQNDQGATVSSVATGSHNNLLITLGNSRQFLIHDVNEISVLDTDAAQDISIALKPSLVELELPELHAQTKGDVIVIPTEAGIDTYLYWNGASFQVFEPLEIP